MVGRRWSWNGDAGTGKNNAETQVRRDFAERRVPLLVPSPPPVFVSVATKGLSPAVSLLFATLAGRFINVAAKGLTIQTRWKVCRLKVAMLGRRS